MAYTADQNSGGLDTLNSSTLADADLAIVGDVSDANRAKAITFTNVKAFLKTYFDTLYANGDLIGPASATDNAITRFDTTTGKLVQNSALIVDDITGNIIVVHPLTVAGTGSTIYLRGGSGGASSAGGQVQIIGGQGGGTLGDGGSVTILGGTAITNSNGGDINIMPGSKNGSGVDGSIILYANAGAGVGAKLNLSSIVSTTKTFTFPNLSGTLALASVYKNGSTTKDSADASTTQNIAHGLGVIPKYVRILALSVGSSADTQATTVYNGTTQSSVSIVETSGGAGKHTAVVTTFDLNGQFGGVGQNRGVVTFDATNIIITWTKTGTTAGTYTLLWEAIG